MKKRWIIPAVVLLLVLLATGVYVTRNAWTAYALKRMVNSQSTGQITLDFRKTEVDVFSKTLTLYEPQLTFKKLYFNKAQDITLKKAKFKKLILINISLWDFLKHKQFICDNLILNEPSFTMKKGHSITKASSFDPTSLINILQNHEISHLKFKFLIRHSQINFGKIRIGNKKDKRIYGSARYNMSIKNLGTISTPNDTLHPLNFARFELSVKNFHRYSAIDRMDIQLDSAFYSSRNNSLFFNGLHLISSGKTKARLPIAKLYLRWVRISGLKTEKQKKTGKNILQLNNIKVVGGSYTFKVPRKKQDKKPVSELLKSLLTTYNIFSLDSLSINHVHLLEMGNKQDTILQIKRINLYMNKIWTTKKILTDPVKSLHYQNLSVSYQEISFGSKKSPIFIHSGESQYISGNKQLIINNLTIKTECKTDSSQSISFATNKFSIDNLSDKKFQKGESQLLALYLNSPELFWKNDSVCRQKPAKLPSMLRPFKIMKINIINGSFGYEANRNLVLNVRGINLFANGLQGSVLSGQDAAIRYNSLTFHAKNSRLSIADKGQRLETGKLLWNNHFFRISGLRFLQSDANQDTLTIRTLILTKPRLNPLLFNRKLIAGGAYLYKASFSLYHQDSVNRTDTLPAKHWNSFVKLPFKTDIGYVRIRRSKFNLTSRHPDKSFNIRSHLDMKLYGLKVGYDTSLLISQPKRWEATLQATSIRQNNLTARIEKTNLNSDSCTLRIQNVFFRQTKGSSLQFRINIPAIRLSSLNYTTLLRSDSLVFGKATVQQGKGLVQFINFKKDSISKKINGWIFIYDSIILNHNYLKINIRNEKNLKIVSIDNLNLLYHPNMLHRNILSGATLNLMKEWDFSINRIAYSDTLRKFHIAADRVAVQSSGNRIYIGRITGTNFSSSLQQPEIKNIYTYFLINDMSLNDISMSSGKNRELHIKNWFIPGMWVNIINNDTVKKRKPASFLSSNFFSSYTYLLRSIHVDSSIFRNVNFSYQYDNMSKLINIKKINIHTSNIQLGESPLQNTSGALFGSMYINLNDRAIISGDSMYTFRTKGIRINLADRKINFDSITLLPRYNRKEFFAKAGYQTDRITLYGKSAVLDNFNANDLLNNHFIHFGNLRLNSLSLRFERDMHYQRRKNIVKPMPIDMLDNVPYQFRIDSVQILNSMVSYFEYEVISKNPGVFFIDNFNVLAENVTNNLTKTDSNLVLKFHGYGKLMKQANLDFTLVMPYFAPHRQWWFSAEAGQIDLTQFNLLTENVLGITVHSGIGSLDVPMITGNDTAARGNVNFLYKKLKIRLYNRKKSQKSKKFYSPFANFMMNSIIIKSNNPPFLGHTKKGIVYFKRIPNRSFIHYLWKSNLSGILSTLGFNNKQQREGKREEKKQTKIENKNKPNPKKKK